MGEAVAKEPSMEEILSSIRKIITDDGGSDVPANAETASEKKPDIKIAKTTQVSKPQTSKPNVAPSAAEIKSALAAIKENVKEAAIETEPAVAAEKKPKIVAQAESQTTDLEAGIVAGIATGQADSISFVDTSSDVAEVETVKEAAQETAIAETVSEVPAQSSKSPTQDNKAMASNEAAKFKGALMSSNTDQTVNNSFEELRRVTMDNIEEKTESMLRPMLSEWLDNNLPTLVERLVREEIERVSGSR